MNNYHNWKLCLWRYKSDVMSKRLKLAWVQLRELEQGFYNWYTVKWHFTTKSIRVLGKGIVPAGQAEDHSTWVWARTAIGMLALLEFRHQLTISISWRAREWGYSTVVMKWHNCTLTVGCNRCTHRQTGIKLQRKYNQLGM